MDQINNKSVNRLLFNEENIGILESIILKEKDRLSSAEGADKKVLNIGEWVSSNDFEKEFSAAKEAALCYLGINMKNDPEIAGIKENESYVVLRRLNYIAQPAIWIGLIMKYIEHPLFPEYFQPSSLSEKIIAAAAVGITSAFMYLGYKLFRRGEYDTKKKKMYIPEGFRLNVLKSMVHEYGHFIFHENVLDENQKEHGKYRIANEGFCEMLQYNAGEMLASIAGNPDFFLALQRSNIGSLQAIYSTLCKKLGRKPREEVMERENGVVKIIDINTMSIYGYGHAFMRILEHKHGKNVYNKILKKDFSFLDKN
jgi:hypothetical protein